MRDRGFALQPAPSDDMAAAPTLADFLSAPVGRLWVSDRVLVWAASPSVLGVRLWGVASSDGLDVVVRCLDAIATAHLPTPCQVVFDVRHVVSVDVGLFDRLVAALWARRAVLARRIARCVVVRPNGFVGALAEGTVALLWRSAGVTIVDSVERAHAALGAPALTPRLHTVTAIGDALSAQSELISRLCLWLTAHPSEHRVALAARALGCSPRSLQRALASAGTTFKRESSRIRTVQARAWLTRDTAKVGTIGRQLGFANESSFRSFMRRHTGQSPRQLRA